MQLEQFDLTQAGAIMSIDPHSLLLGLGNYAWKTKQELDLTRPAFYFSDFFLSTSAPWLQFEQYHELSISDFKSFFSTTPSTSLALDWQSPHQTLFYHEFQSLKQKFACSNLQKAVPYIFAYCAEELKKERFYNSLYHALSYLQQGFGYLYGFWLEGKGLLGVTPELLFQYQEKSKPQLYTMALAGTCSKQEDLSVFKENCKELQEHLCVMQGIKEALQNFGTVHIQELQVLELPVLNHLMAPIQVELVAPLQFDELVRILHPTPALGAFPRQEGRKWLEEYHKKLPRHYYGAPVGLLDQQRQICQCTVAIRNVQWDKQGMRIGVGCGIIQASEQEREWAELLLKVRAVRQVLDL